MAIASTPMSIDSPAILLESIDINYSIYYLFIITKR